MKSNLSKLNSTVLYVSPKGSTLALYQVCLSFMHKSGSLKADLIDSVATF